MKARKIELVFEKKKQLTKEAFEFYFKKPKGFRFNSGQYLKVHQDINNPDERGSSRYFTISSSPNNPEFLTITTRVIKSSFKKKLGNLRKGDSINAFGPLGYFDFNIENGKQKIFLAGGIGLTPYHSILKTLNGEKRIPEIHLFVSFPTKAEAIYVDEFREIERRNSKIKIIYTLTKEADKDFESGRINKDMIIKYAPGYKKAEFFVVGSEATEEGLLSLLSEMKINTKNIFSENFPGY